MPAQSSPIVQAFNRWISTVLESLDNKLDIGSPVPEADKLSSAFGVELTGDATASGSTDGSTTLQLAIVHANTGIGAGEYAVLTVDSKGRAVSGRSLQAADIPTLNQSTTGNAATATKWQTARNVSMSGDGTWTVSLDGSANATAVFTLANSGAVAGVYPKVTIDAKGRVTGGAALAATDIPDLDAAKINSGVFAAARIPTLNQNTTGSAATLTTARNISITGDGSWTVSFNGGANATAAFTLANSGVVAGTYGKVTVDAKGRVTAGAALAAADIPALDTSKLTSGVLSTARGGTGGNFNMGSRNATISTAAPSGGADGDVWFQY